MTDATTPVRDGSALRLSDTEMATWQPLIRLVTLLPQALDRQLRENAGVNHAHYAMLVILAQEPGRRLTMGELARLSGTSPSRLTHAIAGLEQRGWVSRETCTDDRRSLWAVLSEQGLDVLRAAAPTHVAQIRDLVFGTLSDEEATQLGRIAEKLVGALDDTVLSTTTRRSRR